jgi:IS30 family transposase
MKYHQLTSEQRSQIFALLQNKVSKKEIARIVGCSLSTLYRELKRNSTDKGNYLWNKAHAQAMERRKRTTSNSSKDPAIVWEALDLLKEEDWSPEQISADMKSRGKNISHELIYRYIRADKTGELISHCRHKMKYNRHGRPNRTTKVKNISARVSIHERPAEADGTRFGDWEMDTIVGKDGHGAIVTLTERSTNMILMAKLPQGKRPEPLAKVVIRLLLPYKNTIRTITTDNGSEFCAHQLISKALAPKGTKNPNLVYFADSYASWQKGAIENANKLIRQYIPKGTDFSTVSDEFIRKIQYKINRRPRKKLNFKSPKQVFFKQITIFALAS